MTIDELLKEINKKQPPAPEHEVRAFEVEIGASLPEGYRDFLIKCNGGHLGGAYWFSKLSTEGKVVDAGIHHIYGFREESHFSLRDNRECYQGLELRIPREMITIMDDPFGNAICVGISGPYRGKMYFWDHEREPDPAEWDGSPESAGNLTFLCNSFTEFIQGLRPTDEVIDDPLG